MLCPKAILRRKFLSQPNTRDVRNIFAKIKIAKKDEIHFVPLYEYQDTCAHAMKLVSGPSFVKSELHTNLAHLLSYLKFTNGLPLFRAQRHANTQWK